jgi:SpoIID/LytB domain protein
MDANLVSNLQTSTALAIDEEFVFKQFEVLERGDSGRIIKARVHFTNERKIEVNGELAIRQLWSPALRSSAFIIEKDAATSNSKESMWKIRGAGWGHGVGMCQSGAIAMAKSGYSAEAIVSHYYPKAVVTGVR